MKGSAASMYSHGKKLPRLCKDWSFLSGCLYFIWVTLAKAALKGLPCAFHFCFNYTD